MVIGKEEGMRPGIEENTVPTYRENGNLCSVTLKYGTGFEWHVPKNCIMDFYVSCSILTSSRYYVVINIADCVTGVLEAKYNTNTTSLLSGRSPISKVPLLAGDFVHCNICNSDFIVLSTPEVQIDFNFRGVLV